MKKPSKIQIDKLHGAYDYFNSALFGSTLADCYFNFSRRHKNSRGHFSPNRWADKKIKVHEINLNPANNSQRTDKEIYSTLVHEMAHLWQQQYGKPSRSGYHNREWANKMKQIGLQPSHTGEVGGKETGQRMTHYIVKGGPFAKAFAAMPKSLLLPFRSYEHPQKAKPRKSKLKYTCPSCGANAWGKPGLVIGCIPCPALMVPA